MMDSIKKDTDVYGLITELCDHLIETNSHFEDHPYLTQLNNTKNVRQLRSKAFEILLKKSRHDHYKNDKDSCDPVTDLLKHSFVMKTGAGLLSQATELEQYLDELIESGLISDPAIYSTLQFLCSLKSLKLSDNDTLDIFYYGEPNPILPEIQADENGVPPFQIYPLESCVLPKKFENLLRLDNNGIFRNSMAEPGSMLPILGRFTTNVTINVQPISERENESSISLLPKRLTNFIGASDLLTPYFLPCLKESSEKEGIVTEPESPWQNPQKSLTDNLMEIEEIVEEDKNSYSNDLCKMLDVTWDDIENLNTPISNHCTWESLGNRITPREPPFVSECNKAMLHLSKILQAGILPLFSEMELHSVHLIHEIPSHEFISNIKLLMVGVESSTFTYSNIHGFELRKNISIEGVSAMALDSVSYEFTRWGTCFRNLSDLIVRDPLTGKLQIEGLIFKALCSSVKEFLLFYHAAILRISEFNDSMTNLLELLNKIRPLGQLVVKVAELCRCDSQRKTSLGEGIGILTHIYKEVTKVTNTNVALVFYSILKSCCEVYFRFLQQWIFEGRCIDIYEEFMIKVQPQYVRHRGHRFWTRAFGINTKSVPGFLAGCAETILQCGKAVTLLKICDPKNAVCALSASSQPMVRVSLSIGMLRQQIKFYEEYSVKGEAEQNPAVTMALAIQAGKDEEKRRADLVIAAQQDTLSRLKREREEALKKVLKEKSELLEQLKDQVEEAALRKERNRDAELQADRERLENVLREEEEEKITQQADKESTLKYYNDLAEEIQRKQIHADWRARRMKLYDERMALIAAIKTEYSNLPDTTDFNEHPLEETVIMEENKDEEEVVTVDIIQEQVESPVERIEEDKLTNIEESADQDSVAVITEDTDANSNPTLDHAPEITENLKELNHNVGTPTKATRPTVLDISTNTSNVRKYVKDLEKLVTLQGTETVKEILRLRTDNMTEAQRNKLKVLQQEYDFITHNNNESPFMMTTKNGSNSTGTDTQKESSSRIFDADRKSEALANRNRNMGHGLDKNEEEYHSYRRTTESQVNRNRNMAHDSEHTEQVRRVDRVLDSQNLTDLQRNRLRNMTHNTEQQSIFGKVSEVCEPDDTIPATQTMRETPMSCTTDQFTTSTNSISVPMPSYENTPLSDVDSDGYFDAESCRSTLPNLKNLGQSPIFPNFLATPEGRTEESLTDADVDMIDSTSLQFYLEKSVIIPLRAQSRLVNYAVIKYLLEESNMLAHLHSLRSYFFLLNGEFAQNLTQALFTRLYQVRTPLELFNSTTLTDILDRALVSSLNTNYTKLISLSATNVPLQLQTSNPETLSCLSLNYKISWPLNIVLQDVVMQQYSKVFKFLLMVGRVLWVLKEDFQILKMDSQTPISKEQHKLQLYRHSMMQLMIALQTYLICNVLHASWTEFEKELACATTIDEVHQAHVRYIKKILSRCMLNTRSERMRTCLCNIFRVVLKFHNRIRSQKWNSKNADLAGPTYENLEKLYVTFCEQRAYLAQVADKLASSGYQPHLMHFLNALNMNHLYDLTLKRD